MKTLFSGLLLAMSVAFFACSTGGGGDESGGIGNLPKKVYLDGAEYGGNGSLNVVIRGNSYRDTLPAGSIQNGKVTLNLPANIDDRYLEDMHFTCDGGYSCENLSYTNNVKVMDDMYFYADIPSKGSCRLILLGNDSTQSGFVYFSGTGNINGTFVEQSGERKTYNYRFSNGWNHFYIIIGDNSFYMSNAVDTSVTLTWELRNCR